MTGSSQTPALGPLRRRHPRTRAACACSLRALMVVSALVSLASAAFSQPGQRNLLGRRGFASPEGETPVGWRVEGPWQAQATGADGDCVMHLPTAESGPWNKVVWAGYATVERGETISVAVEYRSPTGNVDIGLELCDVVGEHVTWGDVSPAGAAPLWAALRRQFIISDDLWQRGVRTVRPYFQVTGAGAEVSFRHPSLTSDRETPPLAPALARVAATPTPAGDNLAPNPGLSSGEADAPAGYTRFQAGPEPAGQASWVRDKHALKLSAGKGTVGWRSDAIPVDPTAGYEFAAHVRTDRLSNASLQAQLLLHGEIGRTVPLVLSTEPVQLTTTPFDLHLQLLPPRMPPECTSLEVRFVVRSRGEGTGDAWVDGLSLRPLAAHLTAATDKPGNIFHTGEPVRFVIAADSYLRERVAGALSWRVRDFSGRVVASGQEAVELAAKGHLKLTLQPPLSRPGYYELALTLSAGGRSLAQDAISFALVAPFDARCYAADSPFGSHPHGDPRALALAREGYVKWMRTGVGWEWAEPEPGQFRWDGIDAMVKQYEDLGMNLLVTVSGPPRWASSYQEGMAQGAYWSTYGAYPPKDPAAFERFCYELAKRYRGRLRAFEIWNEPNIQFFMGTREQFAEVLKAGYRGLKRGNPDCEVMFDASCADMGFYRDMLRLGAAEACDVLAIHNYQLEAPGPPEDTPFHQGYLDLRKLLALHGQPDKPLWDSEFCWMSDNFPGSPWWQGVGEANQARWLVRSYVYALAAGVKRLFWFPFYPYYDTSTSGPHGGSLIREDLTPKPAFVAYRVAAQNLVGATFLRWLDVGPAARCAEFRRGRDYLAVVWAVRGSTRVSLATRGEEVLVCRLMGGQDHLHPARGALSFLATEDPAYLYTTAGWEPSPDAVRAQRAAAAARSTVLCPPLLCQPTEDGDPGEWWGLAHPVGINTELSVGEGGLIVNDPALDRLSGEVAFGVAGDRLCIGARITTDAPPETCRLAIRIGPATAPLELSLDAGADVVQVRQGGSDAWKTAAGSTLRVRRDEPDHRTLLEAAVPLQLLPRKPVGEGVPLRLTLSARDGRGPVTASLAGSLVMTWRADPTAPEALYSADSPLPRVRTITTVFPAGAAYRYEVWGSNQAHPGDALASGDWLLLVPAKMGRAVVTDRVSTDARHFRTCLSNLLANSSFEQPIATPVTPGLDHRARDYGVWQPDRPYCVLDRTVSHTGACSAKIAAAGRTAADPWSNWGQIIPVQPDTVYSISAYVRVGELGPDAAVSLAIHGYPADSQEQLNNRHAPAQPGIAGWQRVAMTVRTAPGVARLAVWCDVNGNGTAWFDDVQVVPGDLPTDVPEIVGQGFGG